MRPLTENTPKPLLSVAGKPILDHIFAALPDEIDEVIIVVHYLGDKIKQYCGDNFHGRKIVYAEGSPSGTAYSFLAAKEYLGNGRFLFIYGDEMPSSNDIKNCLAYPASIVCWEVGDPQNHGVVTLHDDGAITEIIEKPYLPKTNIIADGVMVLDEAIFDSSPQDATKGEFYFTDMLNQYVRNHKVMAVMSERAIGGISTPEDIKRVEKLLSLL